VITAARTRLCGMQREVWQRLNGTTRFQPISCDEG
jgi:hypothetical protein